MLEVGYEAVTVDALVQRADVARATFYAHFHDVGEVLTSLVDELSDRLLREVLPTLQAGPVFTGVGMRALCGHADEHRALYRVVVSGAGDGRARATLRSNISAEFEQVWRHAAATAAAEPRIDPAVLARVLVGAYLEMFDWWLNEQPVLTAEEVALILARLTFNGAPWLAGVDEWVRFDESDLLAGVTEAVRARVTDDAPASWGALGG